MEREELTGVLFKTYCLVETAFELRSVTAKFAFRWQTDTQYTEMIGGGGSLKNELEKIEKTIFGWGKEPRTYTAEEEF